MVTPVPRAKKMMMFFGRHSPADIGDFQRCFRQQDQQAKRKVFVSETGGVKKEYLIGIFGEASEKAINESLRTGQVNSLLIQQIEKFDKASRTALTQAAHGTVAIAEQEDFRVAALKEAVRNGYVLKFERLHPEAVLNAWLEDMVSPHVVSEGFFRRSPDFNRFWDLIRQQYKYFYLHVTVRDTQFIGYLDILSHDNDLISTARGLGHIPFYRGLQDAPRIITYSDKGTVLFGEQFERKIKSEELSASDLALIAKHLIEMMAAMAHSEGKIDINPIMATELLRNMPNDLSRVEQFLGLVSDPDESKMTKKLEKQLSALRKNVSVGRRASIFQRISSSITRISALLDRKRIQ